MKREQLPIYALALAVLIVGLAATGVSVTSLIVPLLVLACPVMMFFMMRGMHGGTHGRSSPDRGEQQRHEHSTSGRH
jgi:fatty acid desaturase